MYYGTIKNCDIANGVGVRVSLFVSGCRHHCKGCFQPQTWDFNFGKPYTKETEQEIIKLLKPSYITGFSLLGGEPFEPENQCELVWLLRKIKDKYPEKTIWCYTGFTIEQLRNPDHRCRTSVTDAMLDYIDVLVDGPFVERKKNISLAFRGSSNQRILYLRAEGQPNAP